MIGGPAIGNAFSDEPQESVLGRHFGMDWLRIGAFGLLIFYHIGMVFVPWAYHAKVAQPIEWVTIPMQALNAWRLPLLFVVSGYASRAIFDGAPRPGAFAWGRTKRLIPPLLFGIVLIVPPQPWIELTTQHGYTGGLWRFWTQDYWRFGTIGRIALPTWNHLWFVAYLWTYTLVLAIVIAVVPQRVQAATARLAGVILWGPLVVAVPIALLIGQMAWTFPGAAETHAFIDDLPVHRVYFGMFAFGFLLRGSDAVWSSIRRWWPLGLALGIAGYAFILAVEILYPGDARIPKDLWFAFGIARAVQCWATIVALIGIADRWLNIDHPWRATLNEAVFPFYMIHQTIIVVVAGALLTSGIGPLAEFAVLLGATVAGCWLFYWIGRRIGWLRPLIGLRGRVATRSASARAAA